MPLWPLRVKVMKLYPFRLADMLIPMTLAMTLAAVAWERLESIGKTQLRVCVAVAGSLVLLLVAFRVPAWIAP